MDAKLSKLRLFVDSLEREEINEEEQALMLMGGYGGGGGNVACNNTGDCRGSSDVNSCTNANLC